MEEFDNQYSDLAQYGRVRFWDARYAADPEPFEWYLDYETYKAKINEFVPKDCRILMAGCGNSYMMEDMISDGYTEIVGVDFSRVVIEQMKSRCIDYPEITFFTGNMLDTDLPAKTFDAIIDKGLFDSLICAHLGQAESQQFILECNRLLKDTGVLVIISIGDPKERLPFLEHYDLDDLNTFTPWYVDVSTIEKPLEHEDEELNPNDPSSYYWVYCCAKNPRLIIQFNEKLKQKMNPRKKIKKTAERAPNPL